MLTFEVVHFCSILKVLFDTFSIFSFLLNVWWCVEIMQSCIPSIGSVIWIQLYMWWLMYKALSCHWLLCALSQINLFVRNLYDPNLTWNILTPGSAHRSLLAYAGGHGLDPTSCCPGFIGIAVCVQTDCPLHKSVCVCVCDLSKSSNAQWKRTKSLKCVLYVPGKVVPVCL